MMRRGNEISEDREALEKPDMDTLISALDSIWDIVVIGDLEGNLIYVNDAVTKVLGYEPEEYLSGHKVGGIAHPDDRPLIGSKFKEITSKPGKSDTVEVRIRHKEGHYIWIESRFVNLSKNNRDLIVYIIRDITRQKEERERSLQEKARMKAILENTDDMIALRDSRGRLVASNKPWRDLAKSLFDKEIETGTRTMDYLPDDWKQHWEAIIKNKVLKGEEHREQFDYPVDGQVRRYDIMFKPIISNDEILGFTEFNRDITDVERIEDELVESESKYRNIFNNAGFGIGFWSVNGRLLMLNEKGAGYLGGKPEDFQGKTMIEIFGEEKGGKYHQRMLDALVSDDPLVYEDELDVPTGRIVFRSTYKRIEDEVGEILGIHIFSEDITETRMKQERMKNFIDYSPGIYYSYSVKKGASYWSHRVSDILGFDPDDLKNDPFLWHDSIHPDDVAKVDEAVEDGIREGGFDIEYRIRDKNGRWHDMRDVSLMITGQGDDIFIEGMATDITERKRITRELIEQKEFIENISSSFPGVIYQFHLPPEGDMRLNYISKNAHDFFERDNDFLEENQLPVEDIHPEDREEFMKSIMDSANSMEDWDHQYRVILPKSGKTKWVRGISTPHRSPDGGTIWNGVVIDITETRALEEGLKDSMERLEKLIEDIPDGVFIHDMDGNLLMVNKEASKTLGYDKDEMLKMKIWDFDPGIKEEDHPEKYWRALKTDKSITIDTHHRRKDGTVFPVEVKLSLNWIKGKKAIIAMARDVSDRKAMESRFSSFIDSTEDLFMLKDSSLRHIIVNQAYLDFLDSKEEDVLGRTDHELLPESLAEQCRSSDMMVVDDPRLHISEESSQDGRYFETRKFPVPLGKDEIGVGGIIRDITEKKKAEIALEESRRHIETLISNIPGMVYRCKNEKDWPMSFVSEGSRTLLGIPPDRFLDGSNRNYYQYIHPEDREMVWDEIQYAIRNKVSFFMEYRIIDVNGVEKWVLEKGTGVYDDLGNVRFLEGIITDITRIKDAEDMIKEEVSRAEFYLDLLGHDIGNLHQGILSGMEIASSSTNDINRRIGMTSAIGLLRKSLVMVKQVQLLSRVRYTEPKLEEIDICDLTGDYSGKFKALFPDKVLDLRFDLPDKCRPIMAEPMIEAMFFNLFHNAIKFQEGKNAIVEMGVREIDDRLRIEISDHGPGIPDQLKEKVFGRFEVFGQKGRVGLGLALVKVLVDRYKGSIEVKDRIEGDHSRGTTFVVEIPISSN